MSSNNCLEVLKKESLFNKVYISALAFYLLVFSNFLLAGTTGKLSGKVTDSETGEPVIGANIVIEKTYYGAAADPEGYFFINNIPPGEYRVTITAVGYQTVTFEKVPIKIDLTYKLDVVLTQTTLTIGKEVVITAERPLVQKDLTSTSVTISSKDIKMMPVEEVGQIINLQAGVVSGHFRGGRSNEVSYLVDGIPVTDAFNGSMSMEIENSSIRQMEVISGTFNAEYGQAMSGIVNIVTEEGSPTYEGSFSAYTGTYWTSHSNIFKNLNKIDRTPTRNVQASFTGPLGLPNLSFFLTGRYYENEGYLYGIRNFLVTDSDPYTPSGDSSFVPMNPDRKYSFNGKITYSLPSFKFSYGIFWDDNFNKYYDHNFSWTPDGIINHYKVNTINNFQISHYPSQSTFQTLKFAANQFKYYGYLYKDPGDLRYVDPKQGIAQSNYTFRTGGNSGSRYERTTLTYIAQWSLSSQISKEHKLGMGIEGKLHDIYNHGYQLVNKAGEETDSLDLGYMDLGTPDNQAYTRKPHELSAYIQDKIEYDILIINAGVRVDYFNPNAKLPLDLRNPNNNQNFNGAGQLIKAKTKYQISPRLGASFPITDQGILRFSYGHFFQLPNFEHLFANSDFLLSQDGSLNTIMGNPDLKPQKTIMYEVGLQQVLFNYLVLNVTMYYRDIRNLLGMEIINTYDTHKYARYINRDYGNVRGFIATVEKRFSNFFSAKVDYTFQIAEGNASDPNAVYNNNQTDPPIEETKTVVPLDWDQRSTLNLAVTVGELGNWTVGFIFQYGSGWPYTEDPYVSNGVRFENGGIKPQTFNLDLRAEKNFSIGGINLNTFLLVYNLLDIKNEYGVYGTTGRANSDLRAYEFSGEIKGLNTISEYVNNPGNYSSPREIRLGLGFNF